MSGPATMVGDSLPESASAASHATHGTALGSDSTIPALVPQLTGMLAALDCGPMAGSPLSLLLSQLKGQPVTASTLLPFAGEFTNKAKELHALLKQLDFAALPADTQSGLIAHSVSRFIFASNRIEGLSTNCEDETQDIVARFFNAAHAGQSESDFNDVHTPNSAHVVHMLRLLQQTYNREQLASFAPHEQLAFDKQALLRWHALLMVGGTDAESLSRDGIAGQFRQSGARTQDGSRIYPHHTVVDHAIRDLGFLQHQLWQDIASKPLEGHGKLLLCFMLAAFVQFHFVDQHPFADGNGRMCRFLSKRVLDWVLPVPFPMFGDKDKYFSTLIDGREVEPHYSPLSLAGLLLDEAISHYRRLLEMATNTTFDRVIVADSLEQLRDSTADLPEDVQRALAAAFEGLAANTEATIEVGQMKFRLARYPSFCLDI